MWQNKILYQYAILNYRVDCYIPTLCLCIEYDELHHNSDSVKKRDKKRQKEIELSKEYHFIRVNEGSEDKGIGLIIKKAIDLI